MNLSAVVLACSVLALSASVHAARAATAETHSSECPFAYSGDCDTAPSFIDSVAVEYPYMARNALLEGVVVLDVLVLESGLPCDVVIVSGVNPILDRAAKLAAEKSRYAPATSRGKAVPAICRVSYGFMVGDPRFQRNSWPQVPLTHPLVSEQGSASNERTHEGVEYLEIHFEGVTIRGDMSISLFREIKARIEERIGSNGQILRITNYLSLPPAWDREYAFLWQKMGDIGVDVIGTPESSHEPMTQCTHRFYYRDGQFELSDLVSCFHADFARD